VDGRLNRRNKAEHIFKFLRCSVDGPGARFSKAPETFRARKAILSSSVSKNGEVYTPETSCMKETYFNVKKM